MVPQEHPRRVYFSAFHMAAFLALVILCLVLAYVFTGILFERLHWHPPGLALQIVNSLLAIILVTITVLATGLVFGRPRARVEDAAVAGIAQQIQGPVTAIRGFAAALRDNGLSPEERRHYIQIIETESLRLSTLAANLQKLSSPEPYRLDSQLRSLILAYEPQWAGKHITMDAVLDEVSIAADEYLLSQVWIHLIGNAVKCTPDGGFIRVTLHQVNRRIEVAISDTGIEIAPIARQTVEQYGGAIEVRSEPGSGSTFTVTLPIAQPVEPPR